MLASLLAKSVARTLRTTWLSKGESSSTILCYTTFPRLTARLPVSVIFKSHSEAHRQQSSMARTKKKGRATEAEPAEGDAAAATAVNTPAAAAPKLEEAVAAVNGQAAVDTLVQEAPTVQKKRGRRKAAATEAAEAATEPAGVTGGSAAASALAEEDAPAAKPKRQRKKPAAAAPLPAGEAAEAANFPDAEAAAASLAEASPEAKKKRQSRKKQGTPEPPPPVFSEAMRPPRWEGPGLRVLCWNVAGLTALLKKNAEALSKLVESEGADVLCLQETKLQDKATDGLAERLSLPEGWHVHWNCSTERKGYSGTAILSRLKPSFVQYGMGIPKHDGEGRLITAHFPGAVVVCAYVPNSGDGLKRLSYRLGEWDADFAAFLAGLRGGAAGRPVVVAGDLNVAHREIDIHSPKTNLKSAGFTPEERASFEDNLLSKGWVDGFRRQYPGVTGYTYWGYRFNARASNKGWRLDYMLVNEEGWGSVHECFHRPDYLGSDHCPLGLVLKETAS